MIRRGFPVYDSDSRTKMLYENIPGLKERIEQETGFAFSELGGIFGKPEALRKLEAIVHPLVLEDFSDWALSQTSDKVFFESAIALQSPPFKDAFDAVLMIEAPLEERLKRNPKAANRAHLQHNDTTEADYVIRNDGSLDDLYEQVDKFIDSMKTDLSKTLSVGGCHGLFNYVAQARNGIIAESLSEHKRIAFDAKSRITTLADISIYTSEGEMRLSEVFLAIQKVIGDRKLNSKSPEAGLKALFAEAVPNYDADRFYVSHMKKVIDWYNELVQFASLDFVKEEEQSED